MKRMKRWLGIVLSIMLAASSLQLPVYAAEETVPVQAESIGTVEEQGNASAGTEDADKYSAGDNGSEEETGPAEEGPTLAPTEEAEKVLSPESDPEAAHGISPEAGPETDSEIASEIDSETDSETEDGETSDTEEETAINDEEKADPESDDEIDELIEDAEPANTEQSAMKADSDTPQDDSEETGNRNR